MMAMTKERCEEAILIASVAKIRVAWWNRYVGSRSSTARDLSGIYRVTDTGYYDKEHPWNPWDNNEDAFSIVAACNFSIHAHPNTIGISVYGIGSYLIWYERTFADSEVDLRHAICKAALELYQRGLEHE